MGSYDELDGAALERLKQAAEEVSYLVGRGYGAGEVAAFVGRHRALGQTEQALLDASARLEAQVKHHIARELDPEDIERRPLRIDAASTLAAVAAALAGGPLLESAAGVLCDPAYRRGVGLRDAEAALARAVEALHAVRPSVTTWLVDEGPAASAVAGAIERSAKAWRFKGQVKRVPSCAAVLAHAAYVVSSDAAILDACATWFNLPALVVARLDGVRRIRLHG